MSLPVSDYNICKVCLQTLPPRINQAFRANELCSDKCMNLYLLSNVNHPINPSKINFKAKVHPSNDKIKKDDKKM